MPAIPRSALILMLDVIRLGGGIVVVGGNVAMRTQVSVSMREGIALAARVGPRFRVSALVAEIAKIVPDVPLTLAVHAFPRSTSVVSPGLPLHLGMTVLENDGSPVAFSAALSFHVVGATREIDILAPVVGPGLGVQAVVV